MTTQSPNFAGSSIEQGGIPKLTGADYETAMTALIISEEIAQMSDEHPYAKRLEHLQNMGGSMEVRRDVLALAHCLEAMHFQFKDIADGKFTEIDSSVVDIYQSVLATPWDMETVGALLFVMFDDASTAERFSDCYENNKAPVIRYAFAEWLAHQLARFMDIEKLPPKGCQYQYSVVSNYRLTAAPSIIQSVWATSRENAELKAKKRMRKAGITDVETGSVTIETNDIGEPMERDKKRRK